MPPQRHNDLEASAPTCCEAVAEATARRDVQGRTLEEAHADDLAWRAARSATVQRILDKATRYLALGPYLMLIGPLVGLFLVSIVSITLLLHHYFGLPKPPIARVMLTCLKLLLWGGMLAVPAGMIIARRLRDRCAADARIESLQVEVPPLPYASSDPETSSEVNQDH